MLTRKRQKKILRNKQNSEKKTTVLFNKENQKAEICLDDFYLLKLLGKGAFGKVVMAQKKANGKQYAIKILDKCQIIETDQLEHIFAEKNILEKADHPFLVGLQYAFQTEQKIYFVMEFMRGGELFQHLRIQRKFPEPQAKFYAACVLLGICHLHNQNYIYRDLKLENILLDEQGYAKLTDFGLAKFIKSDQKALTFCGTPEYLSPEVLLGKGHNRPADWWSFGILLYEMMFGIPPFYSQNVQNMYRKIVKEPVMWKKEVGISDQAKDLIVRLLEKDWTKRLGSKQDALEIMGHLWFKDIDFDKLIKYKLKAPMIPDLVNWEKNFDSEFIQQKIKEAVESKGVRVDLETIQKFQEEFSKLDYNKEMVTDKK